MADEGLELLEEIIEISEITNDIEIDERQRKTNLAALEILYTQAIELDPDCAGKYWRRGQILSGQGKFDQALEDIEKALELDPENARYLNSRAFANFKRGEPEKSIPDLTKSLKLEECMFTYIGRAECFISLGQYENAAADYEKAIDLGHGMPGTYIDLGDCYAAMGDNEQALANYEEAIIEVEDCANCEDTDGCFMGAERQKDAYLTAIIAERKMTKIGYEPNSPSFEEKAIQKCIFTKPEIEENINKIKEISNVRADH